MSNIGVSYCSAQYMEVPSLSVFRASHLLPLVSLPSLKIKDTASEKSGAGESAIDSVCCTQEGYLEGVWHTDLG